MPRLCKVTKMPVDLHYIQVLHRFTPSGVMAITIQILSQCTIQTTKMTNQYSQIHCCCFQQIKYSTNMSKLHLEHKISNIQEEILVDTRSLNAGQTKNERRNPQISFYIHYKQYVSQYHAQEEVCPDLARSPKWPLTFTTLRSSSNLPQIRMIEIQVKFS